MYQTLAERGFIDTQQDILGISERALEKLNRDVLSPFGVIMSDLNVILEEDVDPEAQRGRSARGNIGENDEENGENA